MSFLKGLHVSTWACSTSKVRRASEFCSTKFSTSDLYARMFVVWVTCIRVLLRHMTGVGLKNDPDKAAHFLSQACDKVNNNVPPNACSATHSPSLHVSILRYMICTCRVYAYVLVNLRGGHHTMLAVLAGTGGADRVRQAANAAPGSPCVRVCLANGWLLTRVCYYDQTSGPTKTFTSFPPAPGSGSV